MSKIGKRPIIIKEGVEISPRGEEILVRGPLGEVKVNFPAKLSLELGTKELVIRRTNDEKKTKSIHGTVARLISNAIEGVSRGFSKSLEVVGTGFKAQIEKDKLILFLGFSHPVEFPIPEGIKVELQENKVKIFGVDKEKVGLVAAMIRKIKKPDVYKGKGIRYLGEKVKLKPGKAMAKAGIVLGGK